MKGSRYLKIVGVINIIVAFAGIICFCYWCVFSLRNLLVLIIGFPVLVFIAPAFGIALYVLGDLKEHTEYDLQVHSKDIQIIKKELDSIKKVGLHSLEDNSPFVEK